MRFLKKYGVVLGVAAVMVSSSPSMSQEDKIITLRDAVAVGVATNPQTGIVENNRRATDEELAQAKALYLPSLDLSADTGYEYTDDPGTRARSTSGEENMWRYETSLTLTQMLFDGWDTKYEVERQRNRIKSASNRVRETAEFVGLDVVEAYLEVLRQRQLLKISRENVAEHIAILEQIEDGTRAGRSTQADVEQAKARVASAKAQESNVRLQLRVAESNYIKRVGDAPQNLQMPEVPVDLLSANVEEEVKVTLTTSPTLDIFEADMDVAEAEWKGSGSTLYPEFDLQLNARQGNDLGGVDGRDTSASALVTMNWNLYRGGGDIHRTREFVYRHAESKERRADAARGVEDDVRQTWARMISAGERAREFAAQAAANQQVVAAYMDQFNLDRRTLLDVLDSQNEWFVSRSNMINSKFLEIFAVYRLVALKGKLLPTLQVAYPKETDWTDNYQ